MFALTVVAQAELDIGGLRTWMLDNLVPLLLLAVAVLLLWLGGGKDDSVGVMPPQDLRPAFPGKRPTERGPSDHAAEVTGNAVRRVMEVVMAQLPLRDRVVVLVAKFPVLWKSFVSAEQLVYFEDETPRRGPVAQAPPHDEPPEPPPEESFAIRRCSINDGQHTYYENEIPTDHPVLAIEPLFDTSTDTPMV